LVDPVAQEVLRRFPHAVITLTEVLRAQGATHRAEAHARRLIREVGNRTGRRARRRALYGPGLLAVTEAITRYREGQSLGSCKSTAWLALVLADLPVRDDAWARMDPEHNAACASRFGRRRLRERKRECLGVPCRVESG
jgi:hypothetical protein